MANVKDSHLLSTAPAETINDLNEPSRLKPCRHHVATIYSLPEGLWSTFSTSIRAFSPLLPWSFLGRRDGPLRGSAWVKHLRTWSAMLLP